MQKIRGYYCILNVSRTEIQDFNVLIGVRREGTMTTAWETDCDRGETRDGGSHEVTA